jgi:hypothetical protein
MIFSAAVVLLLGKLNLTGAQSLSAQQQCVGDHGGKQSWSAADGCNTCQCSPAGIISCTRKLCPLTHSISALEKCKQMNRGVQSWTEADGCGACLCTESGKVCTQQPGCTALPASASETNKRSACLQRHGGRASWIDGDGCQSCQCGDDGSVKCSQVCASVEQTSSASPNAALPHSVIAALLIALI